MGTQPKSKAVEEYRQQIAGYLKAVQLAKGWKNVETGRAAGGVAHTTIGRALKGEHTIGFEKLLALEAASGIAIPQGLRGAAIAAQQPTRPDDVELEGAIRDIGRQLRDRPKRERDALLKELLRALDRAS